VENFYGVAGETEWSLNGRHTGTTELALTANGEKRMKATAAALVGEDRLIAPSKVIHMYVCVSSLSLFCPLLMYRIDKKIEVYFTNEVVIQICLSEKTC